MRGSIAVLMLGFLASAGVSAVAAQASEMPPCNARAAELVKAKFTFVTGLPVNECKTEAGDAGFIKVCNLKAEGDDSHEYVVVMQESCLGDPISVTQILN